MCDLFGRDCQKKLATCEKSLGDAIDNNGRLLTKISLLTAGPPQPADEDLRVLESWLLEHLFQAKFGDRYPVGLTRFSDNAFWVCRKPNIDVYCAYLRDNWLPYVRPYTVVQWIKLSGDAVQIYQVDCDNFVAFVKGINAAHGRWAGLAWGLQWGMCKGVMLSGPHAFKTIPAWEEPYNETTIDGLELYVLEPQVMDTWEVELPFGTAEVGLVVDVVPVPAAGYRVESINLSVD